MSSLFSELKRRKVFRVTAGYLLSAWVLIQVVETIFPAFGFDDAAMRMLVTALALGLVPTIILSWAFELTREGLVPEQDAAPGRISGQEQEIRPAPAGERITVMAVLSRPRFAIPLILATLMAIGAIVVLSLQLADSRVVRQQMLPEIEALIDQDELDRAYSLALEAEQRLPDDPLLERLWSKLAVTMSILSDPDGAEVSYRRYLAGDDDWVSLGRTPIGSVRLPRAVLRWRVQKAGYETAERSGESFNGTYRFSLAEGELPDGMLRVPAASRYFLLTGYLPESFEVPRFRVGRFEVTNEEYFQFVSSGGYDDPAYWSNLTFGRDGAKVPWAEAVARFRDTTGRPGPATWVGGTFPEGAAQLPVTGISWFEAAAYARFRGLALPTIFHWSSMTIFPVFTEMEIEADDRPGFGLFRSELAALSNLSGDGPAPVGSYPGAAPFGTIDAAGNVREWCWNATGDDPDAERYILGASWKDPTYLYTYGVAKSPWDRSEVNGVRLVDPGDESGPADRLHRPVALPATETLTPISDEVFKVYRDLYDYDRTPLNATVESVDSQGSHWIRETVSFDATYGGERMLAHVFLPRNIQAPYQVVVYYPTSDAIFRLGSEDLEVHFIDFIIQSGRAVVFPVLKGTYERNVGLDTTWPKDTREYSNHVVQWIQDFRRTVDYLESRPDMDLDRLGYYGLSWGGWNGPIVLALDDRFKTGVFLSGGIPPTLARPEASSASFASRVRAPVLMISGKDDVIRPVATYQAPMFESLGTPDALKRHAILEGGHLPPEKLIIRETLGWFDKHLGPVR